MADVALVGGRLRKDRVTALVGGGLDRAEVTLSSREGNITTYRDGGLLEGGVGVCLLQAVVPGRGGAALALQGVS